jgi:integrase
MQIKEKIGIEPRLYRLIESSGNNAQTIINYVDSVRNEISVSYSYERNNIKTLADLSKFHSNKKFKEMQKQDIHSYLNSKRKSDIEDPLHGWIATYNLYLIILARFFKWLYYPDLPPKHRPKPSPVEIQKLRRKEISIYKPSDVWSQEDDLLFLRYCSSKRDRCYHAISRDSSCRPHELLKLKIEDVVFKMAEDRQYAEVLVNGKTGQRHIPLINSIPYLKDWLDDHPQSANANAILICGFGKSLGKSLRIESINHTYAKYKDEIFPRLLENPNVPPEDKEKIRELLKKPWNPYIRRHSALTEKSKILKESVLRQYAGWSPNSNMHQKYIHYFGNESSVSILQAYGILQEGKEEIDKMKPKQCPNCQEPNKIESKFCVKCRMILNYDAYAEAVTTNGVSDNAISTLSDKLSKAMADIELLKRSMKSRE